MEVLGHAATGVCGSAFALALLQHTLWARIHVYTCHCYQRIVPSGHDLCKAGGALGRTLPHSAPQFNCHIAGALCRT